MTDGFRYGMVHYGGIWTGLQVQKGSLWWCADWFSGTEWVDPEDPTVIAENELLGAAAAIEAAAKKLEQLRPRTKPKVTAESS